MRVTRSTGRAALLLFMLVTGVLHAAPPTTVKIAILEGEGKRAPKAGVVDLLVAELSKREDVVFLERKEVHRVLAEHKLTMAVRPANAVKLGKLLSTDLFVAVEKLPKTRPAVLRMQIIEARTGVVLAGMLQEAKDLASDVTRLRQAVTLALAKLGTDEKTRRYVGMLPFRSEEVGDGLDAFAQALSMFTAVDLNKSPAVILLDREHLDLLRDEKELTDIDLALRSSAVLLEAGVRKISEGEKYRITFVLRSLMNETIKPVVMETRADDIDATRRAFVAALLTELKTVPPKMPGISPQKEADLFSLHGGRAAAEAAYLLDPNQARLLRLCMATKKELRSNVLFSRYWRNKALILASEGKKVLVSNVFHLPPVELRTDVLNAPDIPPAAGIPTYADKHIEFNWWGWHYRRKKVSVPPEEVRLEKEILKYELACDIALGGSGVEPLRHALGCTRGWAETAEEWAAYLRQILEICVSRTKSLGKPMCDPRFLRHVAVHQQDVNPFVKPDTYTDIEPTLMWMRQQNDPILALTSYMIKVEGHHYKETGAAHEALNFIISDGLIPLAADDPALDWVLRDYVHTCLMTIRGDPEKMKKHLFAILEPMMNPGSASRLLQWMSYQPNGARPPMWLNILDNHMSRKEALQWLRKAHKSLAGYRGGDSGTTAKEARRQIVDMLTARISEIEGDSATAQNDWDDYEISPLDLGPKPSDAQKLCAMRRDGSRLLLVWLTNRRSGNVAEIVVTDAPLTGGTQRIVGRSPVRFDQGFGSSAHRWITCLASVGSRIFVGTVSGGVVVFDDKSVVAWDDGQRLPTNHVRAMDSCRGKLYLWLAGHRSSWDSEGALYRYDPTDDTLTELASTKSMQQRHALDGVPNSIDAILGDEVRGCLWLGRTGGSRKDLGLWRYDIGSGQAERVCKQWGLWTGHLAWEGDRILLAQASTRNNLRLYDPETDQVLPLFSPDANIPGLYGDSQVRSWPAMMMGPHLITAAGSGGTSAVATRSGSFYIKREGELYLYTSSTGIPALLSKTPEGISPEISQIVKLGPYEAIIANAKGNFWRLRRKVVEQGIAEYILRSGSQRGLDQTRTGGEGIIAVEDIKASSFAKADNALFEPPNVADGDIKTCWAAEPADTIGAWISFGFEAPKEISKILFVNGWIPKGGAGHYSRNHRLKRATLHYDNGQSEVCMLHDLNCPQVFTPKINGPVKMVKLVVDEFYPATEIDDEDPPWLNISEVLFFEKPGTQATSGGVRESPQSVAALKRQQGEE
jgi:hypothetical protein